MPIHQAVLLALCATLCAEPARAFAQKPPPQKPETRCGWFQNPTPGNAWLVDRDGAWTIGIQGGHQADGAWPEFQDSQWVATNGHHGHGCACLAVIADRRTQEVSRIISTRARPLRACRQDHTLGKP